MQELVLALDLVRVNMHRVFIVGVYTIVAIAIFAARGSVLWGTGLVLAVWAWRRAAGSVRTWSSARAKSSFESF